MAHIAEIDLGAADVIHAQLSLGELPHGFVSVHKSLENGQKQDFNI